MNDGGVDSDYCFTLIHMGRASGSDTGSGRDGCGWCQKEKKREAYFLHVALDVLWGGGMVSTEALLQFQMVRLEVCWTLLGTRNEKKGRIVCYRILS